MIQFISIIHHHHLWRFLLILLLLYDREPLVSVVPPDQWELREPLVRLEALVLLAHLDPR